MRAEPSYIDLVRLALKADPVVRVTTYGSPGDGLRRIVDSVRVDEEQCVHIHREVFARGSIGMVTATGTVGFATPEEA